MQDLVETHVHGIAFQNKKGIENPKTCCLLDSRKIGDMWKISLLDHVFKHAKHIEFSSPFFTPLFRNFAGTNFGFRDALGKTRVSVLGRLYRVGVRSLLDRASI